MPLNRQYLMRIESPIKLNVINWDGEALIPPEDLLKPEVHFMQFECNLENYQDDTIQWYKTLINNQFLGRFSGDGVYYLTDFDNYLKGNPIVP